MSNMRRSWMRALAAGGLMMIGCESAPKERPADPGERLAAAERQVRRLQEENRILVAQRQAALGRREPIGSPTLETIGRILATDGYACSIQRKGGANVLSAVHPERADMYVTIEGGEHLRLMVILPQKIKSRPAALEAVNASNRDTVCVKFWVQDQIDAIAGEYTIPVSDAVNSQSIRQAAEMVNDMLTEALDTHLQSVLETSATAPAD